MFSYYGVVVGLWTLPRVCALTLAFTNNKQSFSRLGNASSPQFLSTLCHEIFLSVNIHIQVKKFYDSPVGFVMWLLSRVIIALDRKEVHVYLGFRWPSLTR